MINSPQWVRAFKQGAQIMGVVPDLRQTEQCQKFAGLLVRANQALNLTAITSPHEIALKHFADSLSPLSHIPKNARVADIGSGAGFPGLVMAIFRPDIWIASIESSRKKANFQKYVALELGLTNVKLFNIRAENFAETRDGDMFFDVITARALSDLATIISWSAPLLAPHGTIIAMKGKKGAQEAAALKKQYYAGKTFNIRVLPYELPIENAQRSLVVVSERTLT